MDELEEVSSDLVQLARVALATGEPEVQVSVRRLARRYRDSNPTLAAGLVGILRESPLRGVPKGATSPPPVDGDSRLPLVHEEYPALLSVAPILDQETHNIVVQLTKEHESAEDLLHAGLAPTRTALFVGPPGVGKTMAARWIANLLDTPLIILDLASVMSSFLGRTGTNVKRVLDYAKSKKCVLLLDELDAVAKRRDDATEIGELKRLVTVLLQEIDNWPEGSLLLAATNHADLLDPAVWRRFEVIADFSLPDENALVEAITHYLATERIPDSLTSALSKVFRGASFSDIERDITRARRIAVLENITVEDAIFWVVKERVRRLPQNERGRLASALMTEAGISQRRASELTGVSRDTLRKYASPSRELECR